MVEVIAGIFIRIGGEILGSTIGAAISNTRGRKHDKSPLSSSPLPKEQPRAVLLDSSDIAFGNA